MSNNIDENNEKNNINEMKSDSKKFFEVNIRKNEESNGNNQNNNEIIGPTTRRKNIPINSKNNRRNKTRFRRHISSTTFRFFFHSS